MENKLNQLKKFIEDHTEQKSDGKMVICYRVDLDHFVNSAFAEGLSEDEIDMEARVRYSNGQLKGLHDFIVGGKFVNNQLTKRKI